MNKVKKIKVFLISGETTPKTNSLNAILGPFLNKNKIQQFCDEFNRGSLILLKKNIELPVIIYLKENQNFNFVIFNPYIMILLKKKYRIFEKFNITLKDVYNIAVIRTVIKPNKKFPYLLELKKEIRNVYFYCKQLLKLRKTIK